MFRVKITVSILYLHEKEALQFGENLSIGQTLPSSCLSRPFLTRASRALSQACLNSSCPLASFSCCRAISSWSFLSLTCASSLSHWERARISLNCFCKSARLFPKTSEEVWILVREKKRWYKWDLLDLMWEAGCKHAGSRAGAERAA